MLGMWPSPAQAGTREWPIGLELGHIADTFEHHNIWADVLPLLTPGHLIELGLTSLGDRLRLTTAINEI